MKMSGRRMKSTPRAMLVLLVVSIGLAFPVPQAGAATVYHCDQFWIGGWECPNQPYGARHTYKTGTASSGAGAGTLVQRWFVAYTSSNASTHKYYGSVPVGNNLYKSFPNNTELLRGYTFHHPYNGHLIGLGSY